jgi:hypothetical protein
VSDSPPWNREAEVSVTLKHNGKYEAPWLVFRGSPSQVKADIIATIGFDPANYEDKSLLDVALEADKMSKAQYETSSQLGGRVIGSSRKSSTTSVSSDKAEGDTQPTTDAAQEEEAGNPLLKQIAAQESVADLKRLWAENQDAFKDGDLMDAYKARGKELKAA